MSINFTEKTLAMDELEQAQCNPHKCWSAKGEAVTNFANLFAK